MKKFIIDRYNAEDIIEVDVEKVVGPYDTGEMVWVATHKLDFDYGYFTERDLFDTEEEALEVFLAEICQFQHHFAELEKRILSRLFPVDSHAHAKNS